MNKLYIIALLGLSTVKGQGEAIYGGDCIDPDDFYLGFMDFNCSDACV